jgi:hypothetical protein
VANSKVRDAYLPQLLLDDDGKCPGGLIGGGLDCQGKADAVFAALITSIVED